MALSIHLRPIVTAFLVSLSVVLIMQFLLLVHHNVAAMINNAMMALTTPAALKESLIVIPAEIFIYGLPYRLSQFLGISVHTAFIWFVFMVVNFSCIISYYIFNRQYKPDAVACMLFAVALSGAFFILPLLAHNIYGQREHLQMALLFPYILLVWGRFTNAEPSSFKVKILVGLLGSIALIIKPIVAFIPLILELMVFLSHRKIRKLITIEAFLTAGLSALYMVYWYIAWPGYFDKISDNIESIGGYSIDTQKVITALTQYLITAMIILAGSWYGKRYEEQRVRISVFFATLVSAAIVIAIIQQRFFPHHVYAIALCFLFWWVFLARKMPVWSTLLLGVALYSWSDNKLQNALAVDGVLHKMLEETAPDFSEMSGKSMASLGVWIWPFHQVALYSGAQWSFPSNNLAYLGTEYKKHDDPTISDKKVAPLIPLIEYSESSKNQHNQVVSFFHQSPPDFVILAPLADFTKGRPQIDVIAALTQDDDFSSVWSNYILHREVVVKDIFTYRIYKYDNKE